MSWIGRILGQQLRYIVSLKVEYRYNIAKIQICLVNIRYTYMA